MKVFNALGGCLFAAFCLFFARGLFALPFEPTNPHYLSRIFFGILTLVVIGFWTYEMFALAFRRERPIPSGGVFDLGLVQVVQEPGRLTVRTLPKQRIQGLVWAAWFVLICYSLPIAFDRHNWVAFAVECVLLLLSLLMILGTAMRWRATATWDRPANTFYRNGKAFKPLDAIKGVELTKVGAVYYVMLVFADGAKAKFSPTLGGVGKQEDAERFAGVLRGFLGLTPPPAWPPAPAEALTS